MGLAQWPTMRPLGPCVFVVVRLCTGHPQPCCCTLPRGWVCAPQILFEGRWLEVLGCGVVHKDIMGACGLGDHVGYAFGLGLERLAMVLFGTSHVVATSHGSRVAGPTPGP